MIKKILSLPLLLPLLFCSCNNQGRHTAIRNLPAQPKNFSDQHIHQVPPHFDSSDPNLWKPGITWIWKDLVHPKFERWTYKSTDASGLVHMGRSLSTTLSGFPTGTDQFEFTFIPSAMEAPNVQPSDPSFTDLSQYIYGGNSSIDYIVLGKPIKTTLGTFNVFSLTSSPTTYYGTSDAGGFLQGFVLTSAKFQLVQAPGSHLTSEQQISDETETILQ